MGKGSKSKAARKQTRKEASSLKNGGLKVSSVVPGRLRKVAFTEEEEIMILDGLSALLNNKNQNQNLARNFENLTLETLVIEDGELDLVIDDPNHMLNNPMSTAFSTRKLQKQRPFQLYKDMNSYDQRLFVRKLLRDNRYQRKCEELSKEQLRQSRYKANLQRTDDTSPSLSTPFNMNGNGIVNDINIFNGLEDSDDDYDGEGDGQAHDVLSDKARDYKDDKGTSSSDSNEDGSEDSTESRVDDEFDDGLDPLPLPAAPWRPQKRDESAWLQTTPRSFNPDVSVRLAKWLSDYHSRSIDTSVYKSKQDLPIFQSKSTILSAIAINQAVVISGETGSGKTTQLPAYLMEDFIGQGRGAECFIVCTQPRRIAATSVAERVAYEYGEKVGKTVGYQIRLESRYNESDTRILYCTTGVLLRKLQQPGFLQKVSHVLVDEVHERQVETDFLLALLKSQASAHPHLKLVLMSATVQDELFSSYFSCPVIRVSGRTFPVDIYYLEDCHKLIRDAQLQSGSRSKNKLGQFSCTQEQMEGGKQSIRTNRKSGKNCVDDDGDNEDIHNLAMIPKGPKFDPEAVAELVIRLIQTHSFQQHDSDSQLNVTTTQNGETKPTPTENSTNSSSASRGDAVLVFLSGLQAIQQVSRALRSRSLDSLRAYVLILHGSLQPHQQRKVFESAPIGHWKIILSTNIAETSVTVDDVTHVVDCGLHKEMHYDPQGGLCSLKESFVSRASARQRAGRAGRVRKGSCWRMYSERYFRSEIVQEHAKPEIQRMPVEGVVLQVLLMELGRPEMFLNGCPEPPSASQVHTAVNTLLQIKAVTAEPTLPLTALGYHLAKLPVDVYLGKLLLTAALLGCLEPALTIAASLGGKSPFVSPPNKMEEAYKAHSKYIRRFSRLDDTYIPSKNGTKKGHTQKIGTSIGGNRNGKDNILFSDHLAVVRAYDEWKSILETYGREIAFEYCRDNFLSFAILTDISDLRENFRLHLIETGFAAPKSNNCTKDSRNISAIGANSGNLDNLETYDAGLTDSGEENEWIDDNSSGDMKQNAFALSSTITQISKSVTRSTEKLVCQPGFRQKALICNLNVDSGIREIEDDSTQSGDGAEPPLLDLLLCALCAGLSPSIVRATKYAPQSVASQAKASGGKKRVPDSSLPTRLYQRDHKEVFLHPSSLMCRHLSVIQEGGKGYRDGVPDEFVVYHKKIASDNDKVCLYDCSSIPIIGLLLFGGELSIAKNGKILMLNKWIQFKLSELHAVLLVTIQKEWEQVLIVKAENARSDVSYSQNILVGLVEILLDSPMC